MSRTILNRVSPASLGTGTPSSSTFLRGDGAWATPSPSHIDLMDRVIVLPRLGATTLDGVGGTMSVTGTATAATWATTNVHTRTHRVDYLVTAAATTAVAGVRSSNPGAVYTRNKIAGYGGFRVTIITGPATGVSTATGRFFAGLANTTAAPTDVQPSSLTNMVGVGWDAADTNVQIMYNDGAGTASKIDTGWAVPTADRTAMYRVELTCAADDTGITYKVTDMANPDSPATGTLTTDIPTGTTALAPRAYASVGGTSSVVGLAFGGLVSEHAVMP